jgi:hypothetical protein
MKAIVTVDTYYQSPDGLVAVRYMPGEEISGPIAKIAVDQGWAQRKTGQG